MDCGDIEDGFSRHLLTSLSVFSSWWRLPEPRDEPVTHGGAVVRPRRVLRQDPLLRVDPIHQRGPSHEHHQHRAGRPSSTAVTTSRAKFAILWATISPRYASPTRSVTPARSSWSVEAFVRSRPPHPRFIASSNSI